MSSADWLEQYEEFAVSGPDTSTGPHERTGIVIEELELGATPKLEPQPEELNLNFQVPKPSRVNRGKLVSFRSVSGSSGRTVLAANLAFEVAALGRSVCLVDLDFQFPTLHRYFGISSPKAAVLAAARFIEQERLTASTLDQLKVRLVSKGVGVDLISGYGLQQNESQINWESVEVLLEVLSLRYQFVVVDTSSGSVHTAHRLLDKVSDLSVWTSLPDAVSMGRFMDAQQQLATSQPVGESILVVNRVRASVLGARPDWQIQQVLKDRCAMPLAAMIPQDDALDQAMLQGLPLRQAAGRSKALASVVQLAKRLA